MTTDDTTDNEPEQYDYSTLSLDDAVAALAKVRKEAAGWRVKYRDLETTANEDRNDHMTNYRALLVENVAVRHQLPNDLAELLTGSDREELEAQAQRLAQYAPSGGLQFDPELVGGLDPTTDPTPHDPQKRAAELRAQKNRGY